MHNRKEISFLIWQKNDQEQKGAHEIKMRQKAMPCRNLNERIVNETFCCCWGDEQFYRKYLAWSLILLKSLLLRKTNDEGSNYVPVFFKPLQVVL